MASQLNRVCPTCHAPETEILEKGHRTMGRIGHEYVCPQACTCVPEHFNLAEHREFTAREDGPQSCYPDDVKALHEMLSEQREALEVLDGDIATFRKRWGQTPLNARTIWMHDRAEKRIEALRTAIEALGGAL